MTGKIDYEGKTEMSTRTGKVDYEAREIMRSTPSLRRVPNVAFWNGSNVSLTTMALSRPFKEDRLALPLSFVSVVYLDVNMDKDGNINYEGKIEMSTRTEKIDYEGKTDVNKDGKIDYEGKTGMSTRTGRSTMKVRQMSTRTGRSIMKVRLGC